MTRLFFFFLLIPLGAHAQSPWPSRWELDSAQYHLQLQNFNDQSDFSSVQFHWKTPSNLTLGTYFEAPVGVVTYGFNLGYLLALEENSGQIHGGLILLNNSIKPDWTAGLLLQARFPIGRFQVWSSHLFPLRTHPHQPQTLPLHPSQVECSWTWKKNMGILKFEEKKGIGLGFNYTFQKEHVLRLYLFSSLQFHVTLHLKCSKISTLIHRNAGQNYVDHSRLDLVGTF